MWPEKGGLDVGRSGWAFDMGGGLPPSLLPSSLPPPSFLPPFSSHPPPPSPPPFSSHPPPPSLPVSSPSMQLRVSEMELNKAQNMIEHQQEIFSRPARTWIAKQTLTTAASGACTASPSQGAMLTSRLQQLG